MEELLTTRCSSSLHCCLSRGFQSYLQPRASCYNLLYTRANSASYPRGREMSRSLRDTGKGLVWLIGAVVCLCAAPRVKLFTREGSGWLYNAPRYH